VGIGSHKTEARNLLARRDRPALLSWAGSVRNPLRILISLTYDEDELIRWRAIEAAGRVAASLAERDLEGIRDTIRRLLWLMNDESGGLGWHSPELIGEILVNVPALIPEYAELLISFLREEPFERGAHLAVLRVAGVDAETFDGNVSEFAKSLDDPDPEIRRCAALTLIAMGSGTHQDAVGGLRDDREQVRFYDFKEGVLREAAIGQVIKEAVKKTDSSGRAA
jgi:HEAT repeat protein